MQYAVHLPGPPLDRCIERLWYYSGLEVRHRRERVLPEGTFELMINLSKEPRCLFDGDLSESGTSFRRSWVSGAQSRYLVIDALPGSSMIGVHFRPGGAAAVLGIPSGLFRDRVIELEDVWGVGCRDLRDALLEAPSATAKFLVLERELRRRFDRAPSVGRPALDYAVQRLATNPVSALITALAGELGWSHKHFIQEFRRTVGLEPKRFCRIRRFQQVLRQVEKGDMIEWAGLAADCGYFDQSHFIREFREFSGLRPSVYLRERGEYLNFVPIG
ncbi:MAG: AraC family transcriptional regulator [Verrucomicrobiales bacterium]|nr:AraC family transcriptional regulator [Verrucomicrobiales bacterium]